MPNTDSIEPRLIFVISPPRSGSTLLMRMLSAHSRIYSRPEPHLFGPLAHLGYYDTVEKAPYDQHQAAQALRDLVGELPRGEQDYLDACRAYVDVLYGRILEARGRGKRFFLDKTPANALVLPFITKLFPTAKYVVLTRHPAAIFSSYANSFFEGDYEAARGFNPILSRYIPAMATLLREHSVPLAHLVYEDLVRAPDAALQRICTLIGVDFEPSMIEYGEHEMESKGLGDPLTVNRESRPTTASVSKWAPELAAAPHKKRIVDEMLAAVEDRDLELWGNPRASLWRELDHVTGSPPSPPRPAWSWFLVQRKLLVWLRRDIQTSNFGRLVKRLRDICDILLRG